MGMPTPIGWTGFDGGYRRAVSFARTPRDNDDEPPRRRCGLSIVFNDDFLPTCYAIDVLGTPYYVDYTAGWVSINGDVWSASNCLSPWTIAVEQAASTGTLYTGSDCVTGPSGPISGWAMTVTVTKSGSTYTVTGVDGATTIFLASGAAGAALSNTVGSMSGTVTVTPA